jgi:hypothetical protein
MNSIFAKKENGKLIVDQYHLMNFKDGQTFDLVPHVASKSMGQLRMYRAWLDNTAQHTGNDPEALHEILLESCAPRQGVTVKRRDGTTYEKEFVAHSSRMDKLEMSEYMDRCAVFTGYSLPTEEELQAMGSIRNSSPKCVFA